MSDATAEVLDMDVIESLKELSDDDEPSLLAELVGIFLQDTPGRLEELNAAVAAAQADGIEKGAHALKSSCANLGAVNMSGMCQQLEASARSGDISGTPDVMAQVNEEFERVKKALAEYA